MKIGLISINAHTKSLNPACPIHTWAFQQFLKRNGIDSTVIDYIPNYNDNFPARDPAPYYERKYAALSAKHFDSEEERAEAEKKLRKYEEKLKGYTALRRERMTRFDKFQKFIEDNYAMTEMTYDEEMLEGADPGFDCYICVTDVIWSCDPYWGFDPGFFLDCGVMDNKWKIAYAASRGVPKEHTQEQKEYFFRALSDFDYIGVRERSLKEYIDENLPDKKATVVLDPVLLLEQQDYEEVIVKPEVENYIVVYYAMERPKALLKVAADYARRHGCRIVELTHIPIVGGLLEDSDIEVLYKFDIGPGEWLGFLKYAKCIFTNSFHATCFSILFHKNFFTGKRNGDKLSHVLDTFGLDDRRIAVTKDTDLPIDYERVERKLKEERLASAEFILSAIHTLEKKPMPDRDRDSYKRSQQYPLAYNSGKPDCVYRGPKPDLQSGLKKLQSGNFEFRSPEELATNNGESCLRPLMYEREGYSFSGWHLRVRIRSKWYWVKKDGTLMPRESYSPTLHRGETMFEDRARIPYMPVRAIAVMVADGVWEKKTSWKRKVLRLLHWGK